MNKSFLLILKINKVCRKKVALFVFAMGWLCVSEKNKCAANVCWFVSGFAALLFFEAWACRIFISAGFGDCLIYELSLNSMPHNGFGLCVRAGFGAQSFNLLLKFIRSTMLQVFTSARLTQNPC